RSTPPQKTRSPGAVNTATTASVPSPSDTKVCSSSRKAWALKSLTGGRSNLTFAIPSEISVRTNSMLPPGGHNRLGVRYPQGRTGKAHGDKRGHPSAILDGVRVGPLVAWTWVPVAGALVVTDRLRFGGETPAPAGRSLTLRFGSGWTGRVWGPGRPTGLSKQADAARRMPACLRWCH